MPFPNERTYSFDANLQVSDNAAPYTATGFATVGGAQAVIDLQGNQGTSPKQQARGDFCMVVDVTAIALNATDEYQLAVLVSNDPNFGPGNVEQAGGINLGLGTSRGANGNLMNSATGRYEIMFSNNIAGSIYEYAALYLTISGTTPSINLSAFLAVLPEM